jgi:transposase
MKNTDPRKELKRLYCEEGKSLREIGKILGVSRTTVMTRLNEYGISASPNKRLRRHISEKDLAKLALELSPEEMEELRLDENQTILKVTPRELRRLYLDERLPIREIYTRLDVSEGTIYKYLDEYDIPKRGSKHKKQDPSVTKEELHELYVNRGLSSGQIGEMTGVSHTTIVRYLHRYDIPVRNPGPQSK